MVYLIHFDQNLKHARHYIGFTDDLQKRLKTHRAGYGGRLMAAVIENGINWRVARTWPDATRNNERYLKNKKNAPALCPICSGKKALNYGVILKPCQPKNSTDNSNESEVMP